MTEPMLVSVVLLWVLVLVLTGLVLALARQVGVLHERIAPVGALALSAGPKVGEPAPSVVVESLSRRLHHLGERDPAGRPTLLFFLSPRCPVCETLLPTARQIARSQRVRLLFASDGDELDHQGFVDDRGLSADDYIVSSELGLRYQIAKLPYAVLIDGEGTVRAQGLVNTREHLESLFEARDHGVGSVQEYLGEQASLSLEAGPAR